MEDGCRTQFLLCGEVPFDDPVNGSFPLWVGCAKDFIEHVQVNSEPLDIVFDGSQAKIDQMNVFTFDQNVVAGQISVGRGHAMEPPYRPSNPIKGGFSLLLSRGRIVQHFDERSPAEVFNDELTAFVIQIPNGWNGEACFSGPNQQSCFAYHATNAQTVIEVWMTPRAWASLFSYGRPSKPVPAPDLGFCAEVQPLLGREDHASLNKRFFLNIHAPKRCFKKG